MNKQTQRRLLALVLAMVLAFSFLIPLVAHAAEIDSGYGNEWVYDEAQVVGAETEAYIKNLNEEIFANYANKPQLAFIVLNDLPYNMDDYKLDMFNEYGVGTKTENHGMLFVFAINDREYALEIGDGFVKGSILRKELETDFITEEMKNSLRAGDYDTVVYQVAEHLAGMMADEENLVYAQKEEAAAAKRAEEEAAAALRHEQFEKAIPWIIGGFLAVVTIGSLGYIVSLIVSARKKEQLFGNLEHQYAPQFALFGEKEADAHTEMRRLMFDTEYGCDDAGCFEDDFARHLHNLYLKWNKKLLRENYSDQRNYLYEQRLESRNNFLAFSTNNLAPLNKIVQVVDEEEDKKIATRRENEKRIEEFWEANKHRVENAEIITVLKSFMFGFAAPNRLISKAELEKHFLKKMKELNFEYECDRFCEENADLIKARDFNRTAFYHELANSSHGKQYRYSSTYNNFWMRHYLITHMSAQRKLREQREAEERRRAQQRKLAVQRQAQRRNNSSFGTSFRGGFSSGGGFKGGW